MSEEQARQRAQKLTKKALAEAEKETFKIDRSLQGKHIVTKSEQVALQDFRENATAHAFQVIPMLPILTV